VVRQQSYLKTILQSIDVSKKKLDILVVRRQVGVSNDADVFQAQLDLNALVQSQQSQQLVIDQAKTDLVNLIFMKPGSQISISDTIIVDKTVNIDSVHHYVILNPNIIAANQQIHINELIEKETAAQRYPTLKATTGYNFTNASSAAGFTLLNQSYGPFVGLNLAIPIYNGSIFKRQQQMAVVNTRISRMQRDELSVGYESGMFRTYQAYTSSLSQLKTEQENYNLSIKLLDLVLQRFQVGQATIIDVKQAQQSFEDEGYRLVNLNYAAKAAEIELKRLAAKL
jgi:outer membrane protein TolC